MGKKNTEQRTATTIRISDEYKQIFKDIKYVSDKPMQQVVDDLFAKHLLEYLEEEKRKIKRSN